MASGANAEDQQSGQAPLNVLAHDSDSEWEYEYDENETEVITMLILPKLPIYPSEKNLSFSFRVS